MTANQELDRKSYRGPQPPTILSQLLNKIGGQNLFGEPNFRLVWALDRLTPSGGTWLDWPRGSSLAQRNQLRGARPWRREIGVRMIPRYGPIVGWALEKWVPPQAYGSRERWYSPSVIGGTMVVVRSGHERIPSQGEYPSRGDYEYTGFLFQNDELAESTVITAMQMLIWDHEELPTNPARRIALRAQIAAQANAAADAQYEQWALDQIEDRLPAFNGQIMSSGAGRKHAHSSAKILKKLGISSHHIS